MWIVDFFAEETINDVAINPEENLDTSFNKNVLGNQAVNHMPRMMALDGIRACDDFIGKIKQQLRRHLQTNPDRAVSSTDVSQMVKNIMES